MTETSKFTAKTWILILSFVLLASDFTAFYGLYRTFITFDATRIASVFYSGFVTDYVACTGDGLRHLFCASVGDMVWLLSGGVLGSTLP